jgi:hypothetical protein
MRTSSHAQTALVFHKFLVLPHRIELWTLSLTKGVLPESPIALTSSRNAKAHRTHPTRRRKGCMCPYYSTLNPKHYGIGRANGGLLLSPRRKGIYQLF